MGTQLNAGGEGTPAWVGMTAPHESGHAVQFYESAAALATSIAEFAAGGMVSGQPALLVLRAEHRPAVERELADRRVGVAESIASGLLTFLDAHDLLARIMRAGAPDAARFDAAVGTLVQALAAGDRRPRVFGEMVDILVRDGNPQGALALEGLWNDLGARVRFDLLCAYALDGFANAADARLFAEVCRHHRHVTPAESFTRLEPGRQAIAVSALQQQARALTTEVDRREQVERELRDALLAQARLLEQEREARAEAERAMHAAEEANRAKNAFLAVMSHELRTPLNAIRGYVELLTVGVYGDLAPEQMQALERVRGADEHLLTLIDEVLTYAQVGARTIVLDTRELDLDVVVEAAVAQLHPVMREKGIAYAHRGECGTRVRADVDRTRQILLNLLANAVKFTEPGGQVTTECIRRPGLVEVRVRDTGIGIAPGQLEAIFEPFVQGDSQLTRAHGGVGLGLAIARELARRMGGELTVESEQGSGATFILTLPAAGAAAE